MPVAIWPIAYIDSYSEVWGGWGRSVEGGGRGRKEGFKHPRASRPGRHIWRRLKEVISSSFRALSVGVIFRTDLLSI